MVQYIILIAIGLVDLETFHGYCNTGNGGPIIST
jgi:hypothetical protein